MMSGWLPDTYLTHNPMTLSPIQVQQKIETTHFSKRLSQRFGKEQVDLGSFQMVTRFSTNRYKHPNVMEYLRKYKNCKYLVNVEQNMVIPINITGHMITALYYRIPLKLYKR